MRVELFFEGIARIRQPPGQAFVQHAGQRVDVRAVVGHAPKPLRGHIGHRAHGVATLGECGVGGGAGKAEVDQVDELPVGHQDVGRLDVAVDQPHLVCRIQCCRNLFDHRDGALRVQPSAVVADVLQQVAALDQAHVDVESAVDLAVAVDRHHVRVVQTCRDACLAAESLLKLAVLGQMCGQHLERDDPVGAGVVGAIDLSHAAAAQQLTQFVLPE